MIQVVEQTHEEKVKMYMKESKKKLVEMLIECNKALTMMTSYPPSVQVTKAPFQCPVCGGNGLVSNGFYNQAGFYGVTTDAAPETCRTCNGRGMIWVE